MNESGTERMLGILIGKMEGIEKILARSEEQRATVHRRVDELKDDVADMRASLHAVEKDVAQTKAVTDQVQQWKLLGMGALAVTGLAFSAITALIASYGSDVLRYFRG